MIYELYGELEGAVDIYSGSVEVGTLLDVGRSFDYVVVGKDHDGHRLKVVRSQPMKAYAIDLRQPSTNPILPAGTIAYYEKTKLAFEVDLTLSAFVKEIQYIFPEAKHYYYKKDKKEVVFSTRPIGEREVV